MMDYDELDDALEAVGPAAEAAEAAETDDEADDEADNEADEGTEETEEVQPRRRRRARTPRATRRKSKSDHDVMMDAARRVMQMSMVVLETSARAARVIDAVIRRSMRVAVRSAEQEALAALAVDADGDGDVDLEDAAIMMAGDRIPEHLRPMAKKLLQELRK